MTHQYHSNENENELTNQERIDAERLEGLSSTDFSQEELLNIAPVIEAVKQGDQGAKDYLLKLAEMKKLFPGLKVGPVEPNPAGFLD